MEPEIHPAETLTLLRENNLLLKANNEILQKMERRHVRGIWFKAIWFIVLFILPLLLLPYFMNSYLTTLGLPADMGGGTNNPGPTDNAQKLLDLLRNNPSNPR